MWIHQVSILLVVLSHSYETGLLCVNSRLLIIVSVSPCICLHFMRARCTLAVSRLCRRNVMLTSSCSLLEVLLPQIASPTGTRCHPKYKHWHDWVNKRKLRLSSWDKHFWGQSVHKIWWFYLELFQRNLRGCKILKWITWPWSCPFQDGWSSEG